MVMRRYLDWRARTARPPVRLGAKAARLGALAVLLALAILAWPVGRGWLDGRAAAPVLAARADALIADGRGPDALGGTFDRILAVQDPGFRDHRGVDLSTPGAGITTMTQSLAKRVGFDDFRPGWAKLRQTGLALGYETRLSKDQIAALWLDTAEMGLIGKTWTVGMWNAARRAHGAPLPALDEAALADLVARLIAPGRLGRDAAARAERAGRIRRLWAGTCAPRDHGDVWLEGCA